jgi:hypothetical protein
MTSWGAILIVSFVILGTRRKPTRPNVYLAATVITTLVLLGVAIREHTL